MIKSEVDEPPPQTEGSGVERVTLGFTRFIGKKTLWKKLVRIRI